MFFKKVDDAKAIIKDGYVERQVDVYTRAVARNGAAYVYVEIGSKRYLKLAADGSTHNPKVRLLDYDFPFVPSQDELGRMIRNVDNNESR